MLNHTSASRPKRESQVSVIQCANTCTAKTRSARQVATGPRARERISPSRSAPKLMRRRHRRIATAGSMAGAAWRERHEIWRRRDCEGSNSRDSQSFNRRSPRHSHAGLDSPARRSVHSGGSHRSSRLHYSQNGRGDGDRSKVSVRARHAAGTSAHQRCARLPPAAPRRRAGQIQAIGRCVAAITSIQTQIPCHSAKASPLKKCLKQSAITRRASWGQCI